MYMGVDNDLNTQVQWESLTFKMCVQTEDHYEGLKAFLGKKKPHFRGK
jgi:enoyl-CoA hydratase/carnithine racemase